jgi:hypothetical protein
MKPRTLSPAKKGSIPASKVRAAVKSVLEKRENSKAEKVKAGKSLSMGNK